jgi:hypothetical protein
MTGKGTAFSRAEVIPKFLSFRAKKIIREANDLRSRGICFRVRRSFVAFRRMLLQSARLEAVPFRVWLSAGSLAPARAGFLFWVAQRFTAAI